MTAAVVAAIFTVAPMLAAAQATPATAAALPRMPDGKPDLEGIWEAISTADWNIQDHSGELGVPAGRGIVEGNEIPYRPEALAKRKENFDKRATLDPNAQCYMPGVPRIAYMSFPFQIFQFPEYVSIIYEYLHIYRMIHLDGSSHPDPEIIDFWMGDSRGHWEGNTLVVDVKNFNDQTWFDRAGNFHSDGLHVVERYTLVDRDHLSYEATIEDPKVFTKPWKISLPLYRHQEKDAQILEYECYAYKEDEAALRRK